MLPLLGPLVALIAGILASPWLDPGSVWLCLPLSILLTCAKPRFLLLTASLLGAGLRSMEPPVPPDPGDLPVRLEGTLRRAPEWRGLGVYLDVQLLSVDEQTARGRVRLTEFLDDPEQRAMFDALELGTGDRLEVLVKLSRPVVYRNPGVFNYRRYLERRQIYWTGNIRNARLITVLERGWHGADRVKNWIARRLEAPFAEDPLVRGLVMGMVLGHKHGLTATTERQFQAGGLYHLVVVSGFNLAVVAGIAFWIARRLPWKRHTRLWFVLLAAIAYAALVEGDAPVVRAALMVGVAIVGRLLDRRHAAGNAVCATAIVILLVDPTALEDSGFQMSFAAIVAIVAIAVPLIDWSLGWLRRALTHFNDTESDGYLDPDVADWRISRRLWCELRGLPAWLVTAPWRVTLGVAEAAIVSVCVEIVFLVFMVESFHRISPVSPVLNIPAGLIAAAVTPMGLALIVLPGPMAAVVASTISGLLHTLQGILEAGLALPMATFRVPSVPVWVWAIYGVSVVGMVAAIRFRKSILFICALAAIVAGQWGMATIDFAPPAPPITTLRFLDVGQGDATLVELPDGRRILIDGGGAAAGRFLGLRDESTFSIGEDVVSAYLFRRHFRRIDVLVLTHAHFDHLDGLLDVVENFEIGEVWLGRNPMVPIYRDFLERVMAKQVPIRWVAAGDRVGPFEVLHPPAHWRVRRAASNDDSVVLLVDTGKSTALLTGDIEQVVSVPRRVDVYKLPHHGSRGVRLRVEAPIRVVSVGANNPFGHPHVSVGPALRTDRWGLVTVVLE